MIFLEMCKHQKMKQMNSNKDGDISNLNKKYKNTYNLKEQVDTAYKKMRKEKKDDPSIKIAPKFKEFIENVIYMEFLEAMLDYCKELFRLESKQKSLEMEARTRGL